MTTLDLTLLPLYRLADKELPVLPGLLALTAPRKPARGRDDDRLIVYLVLTGNATLSTAEYMQLTSQTASSFFETQGALTTALRAAAESLNRTLLDRNLNSSEQGQYVNGWLVMGALRDTQITILKSGPTHIYTFSSEAMHHIHEPSLSGKGLGLSQSATYYLHQTELQAGDRLIFVGKPASELKQTLIEQQPGASIEATRRHIFSKSEGNINAILMQVTDGSGTLTVLRPTQEDILSEAVLATPPAEPENLLPSNQQNAIPPADSDEAPAPHDTVPEGGVAGVETISDSSTEEQEDPELMPSAYATPPQGDNEKLPEVEQMIPEFPASIPRAAPTKPDSDSVPEMDDPIMSEPEQPKVASETTRQVAQGLVNGIQAYRRLGAALTRTLGRILPNLLPGNGNRPLSSSILMTFIAIFVPILVVTVGSTVYLKFGRSYQYDNIFLQAQAARALALNAADPVRQRDGWQDVLFYLDKAEFYRVTSESQSLRDEAQSDLDQLLGIVRLNFYPAFDKGVNAQISRLAANETDLYMLDAERGRVLHASQIGRNFELNEAFRCEQGQYGDYRVGPIVDILILPRLNSLNAGVLGIDAGGTLLYCAPGRVGQAIPLAVPDTNWGRVTGFTLDGNSLYVLDAPSRAIWVYNGQNGSFLDRPYFFFGGQIPEIQDAIDLVVNGDELYILHADGHLSNCSYSRLEAVPTRCQDPAELLNTIPAYQGINLFEQAHITQMMLTSLPDSTLLLLDADNRSVLRLSPRTLELQNQIFPIPGTALKLGPVGAMTVSPTRVLFMAVDDQIHYALDMP